MSRPGVSQGGHPCPAKGSKRRGYGGSISRRRGSRKSARWGCLGRPSGRSSAGRLRCSPPSTSRIFFRAQLGDGLG
jgi:hypothetical protein